MNYEIDFLPVGEGSRSGDAIAIRFGEQLGHPERQFVITIDGGTQESGERLVEHVRDYYETERVNLAIATHLHNDHISGTRTVVEELEVEQLLMHLPWEHVPHLKSEFKDGRLSAKGLSEKARKGMETAWDLHQIAVRKGTKVSEPFSDGFTNPSSPFIILGPSQDFYRGLLPDFSCLPVRKEATLFAEVMRSFGATIRSWVHAVWNRDELEDPSSGAVSPENNSSVVLLLRLGGRDLLFTGDAGVEALSEAATRAAALGIDLKGCHFYQIPHHGSRRNLGPTILNEIVGPIVTPGVNGRMAFVSAAADGAPKHPSQKVVNSFFRRGVKVVATQGVAACHHFGTVPDRGWGAALPLEFKTLFEVEEEA